MLLDGEILPDCLSLLSDAHRGLDSNLNPTEGDSEASDSEEHWARIQAGLNSDFGFVQSLGQLTVNLLFAQESY